MVVKGFVKKIGKRGVRMLINGGGFGRFERFWILLNDYSCLGRKHGEKYKIYRWRRESCDKDNI